jgi:hypothetical protein
MGRYDELRCEAPLPDGTVRPDGWQTKNGPCEMGTVTITADGRLLFEDAHHENVPEEERPYYGKPQWFEKDGVTPSFFSFAGCMRRVVDAQVEQPFHGDVNFYNDSESYIARFTEGRLSRIFAEAE